MAGVSWTYNPNNSQNEAAVISATSDSTVPLDVRDNLYHTITIYSSGISTATIVDVYTGNNISTGLVNVISHTLAASGGQIKFLGVSGGSWALNGVGRPLAFNWLKLKKRDAGVVWLTHQAK